MSVIQKPEEKSKKPVIPNLLRPQQVIDTEDEINKMEGMLSGPFAKNLQDPGEMRQRVRRLKQTLDELKPQAYKESEIDAAKKRADELLDEIREGMLTQKEMRANPVGAVEANDSWQKANKPKIAEWKHIMLRLNAGTTDNNVANLEHHRPKDRPGELNLDVAQIERKFFMGLEKAGSGVVIDDEEKKLLKAVDDELAASLATLSNDQRVVLKSFLKDMKAEQAPEATPQPKKRGRPRKSETA